MEKKGSEKYYIIISLILGLILVAIVLYFLFHEYFTTEDINWQVCKESILLRSGNINRFAKAYIQENFPFKCKTEVIKIDYYDEERASKEIADTIASCFGLYGEGRTELYGTNWFSGETKCFVCARIHFSEDVKDKYSKLDIGNYMLSKEYTNGETYFDYVYWNTKVKKEDFIRMSLFDSKGGDIFVIYMYNKPNYVSDPSMGMIFFQPAVKPQGLQLCNDIETIPA